MVGVMANAKKMFIYKPKSLIDGARINQPAGSSWVAIPDKYKGRRIKVIYGGAEMIIKDYKAQVQMYRRFTDKFWTPESGRSQYYTLGYFKFVPEEV